MNCPNGARERNRGWVLALGLFTLALGQVAGHVGGPASEFCEGLGVGLALVASGAYIVWEQVSHGRE
jgi:hypothetical protein